MNIAIIFAGGVGQRLNSKIDAVPKQFLDINGKPIIIHTLQIFQDHNEIDKIYIAVLPEYKEYLKKLIKSFNITKVVDIVNGGETGQDSIFNALIKAQSENPDDSIVLIHDGVRPIVAPEVVSRNIESVKTYGSAITCTPCYETILISEDGMTPHSIPFRKDTYSAQAPQSFFLNEIISAHKKIRSTKNRYENMIDSCTIYNTLGIKTNMIKGNFGNIKVTTPEDLCILRALLNYRLEEQTKSFKSVQSGFTKSKKPKVTAGAL